MYPWSVVHHKWGRQKRRRGELLQASSLALYTKLMTLGSIIRGKKILLHKSLIDIIGVNRQIRGNTCQNDGQSVVSGVIAIGFPRHILGSS